MVRRYALGLFLIAAIVLPMPGHAKTLTGIAQQKKLLIAGKYITVHYLLYLPPGFQADARRKWPLILFLHGSTEKGDDLAVLKREGLPAYLEKAKSFPFVVISPQLPMERERWDPVELKALLDAALPDLRVDRERVYLTGWSLGANGVWRLATRYPEVFAAIAPVAGWGDAGMANALKNVPVWAFHGARDTNVLPRESSSMVDALRKRGGEVRFTLYPDLEHDCWIAAYKDVKLYEWFLQHRRTRIARAALRGQHVHE